MHCNFAKSKTVSIAQVMSNGYVESGSTIVINPHNSSVY